MVKNELSIRSQQTYKVAQKIAEHEITKAKNLTKKALLNYEKSITFKSLKQEKELYDFSMNSLKDNIDALLSAKSELSANNNFLKSNYKLLQKESLYLVGERELLNRANLIRLASLKREALTKAENLYKRNAFLAQYEEKEKSLEIDYKLNYSKLLQETYGDNLKREAKTYDEFYKLANSEYEKIHEKSNATFETFLSTVYEAIDTSYNVTFALEIKTAILNVFQQLKENHLKIENNSIEVINRNIDLTILKEQTKEGLDVADEIKENQEAIEQKNKEIEEIKKVILDLENKFKQLLTENASRKVNDFTLDLSCSDELQNKTIVDITKTFKLSLSETFKNIYNVIKQYYLSLCPFYYDYLANCEEKYEQENKEYRLQHVNSLDKDLAKLYLNDGDGYLRKIVNHQNDEDNLAKANQEHLDRLEEIKKEYKEDLAKLKQDKANRKQEYLDQKAAAKINLKNADGAKASEIRDVLKLYKKEINSGEFKRYRKVNKLKNKKLAEEKANYSNKLFELTNSEALVYKRNYELQRKNNAKEMKKELATLNRTLNKEAKSSKYRRNFTTKSRENALGYTFLSIWGIGFLIFTLIPILYTIMLLFSHSTWTSNDGYSVLISFNFQNGLTFPNWAGFDNFEQLFMNQYYFLFTQIPQFFRSLLFFVPLVVFIGFVLAMLLNSKIKGRTIFRIIYFLPVVIVSGPVLNMLNNSNSSGQSSIRLSLDGSSISKMLSSISPQLLTYANEVFQNLVIILWMTGVPIVLFISALQKINKSLYEAAEIDGANKWQMLWTITFPLIKSVILIVCLFTIMQVATIDVSFVNPINSWITTQLGMAEPNYGVAAVGAWTQTLVVLIFVLISFLLFREKEFISKDKNFEEIEEEKKKKQQRRAKIIEIFKINEIKNFFRKMFAPITKAINASKEKKKLKEERGEE